MMFTAAVMATLCSNAHCTQALHNGPWCSVVNTGAGRMEWDCRYRTIEECVPNVLSGNRGFCDRNPSYRLKTKKQNNLHSG